MKVLAINLLNPLSSISELAIVWGSLVALWSLVQTIRGSNFRVIYILHRSRMKSVGKALFVIGIPRRKFFALSLKISKACVQSGEKSSVQRELNWVAEASRRNDQNGNVSIVASKMRANTEITNQLNLLAKGYDNFGARLRANLLLSSNEVLKEQEKLAFQVSDHLAINAGFSSDPLTVDSPISINVPRFDLDLELYFPRLNFSPEYQLHHVDVTHINETRVVSLEIPKNADDQFWKTLPSVNLPSFYAAYRANSNQGHSVSEFGVNEIELIKLKKILSGRAFDGVLPAVHTMHFQRDPLSGHRRLLLEITEINYSAVNAMNYTEKNNGVGRSREDLQSLAGDTDRLVTLTLMLVSSDGFLLLTTRSKHVGSAPEKISVSVNGNLELRPRLGLELDRDKFGLPDLLVAIVREAKEELGVKISKKDIVILGLAKFSSAQEVETWILSTYTLSDKSVQELVNLSRKADLTEGSWELSNAFLKIKLPTDTKSARKMIKWVVNADNVTPHLTQALIELCIPFLTEIDAPSKEAVQKVVNSLRREVPQAKPDGYKMIWPNQAN